MNASTSRGLPPLPPEDHACADCGVSYLSVGVSDAVRGIRAVPAEARGKALAVPADRRTRRPQPGTWSVVEYACHLRDVYATYTIRLHRTRTEDRPVLEPMLNDLRVRRFRYNERDLLAVLDELAANAAGFCEEAERMPADGWDRTATRLPREHRTARWLVRQAMHEGVHHVRDIAAVGAQVAETPGSGP